MRKDSKMKDCRDSIEYFANQKKNKAISVK